jgi:EAL domain-containing protein (putative c-di-GMP-specific phosphodiesterase class I)
MHQAAPCAGCTTPLEFELGMAFHPIVDIGKPSIFAYEALVRGPAGEPAASVFDRVTDTNRYAFDQRCRVRAVESAARLGMQTRLSINFMPNAVYEANRCLRTTLEAARKIGFPLDRIIFEATEGEQVEDTKHLLGILAAYKRHGFQTAIDDFGAGYAGLNLLAEFQPDIVKLDMGLVRAIDTHRPRRAIAAGIVGICRSLGIRVVAEGVETTDKVETLKHLGISLMQGYVFGKPVFEALPSVEWSAASRADGSRAQVSPL